MGFINNLLKPIKKITHIVKNIAGKIWHSIKKGVKDTYDFVRTYWKEILFGIIGGYAFTRTKLGSFLKKIGGKFGDGVKDFWKGLSKIIIWLKNKIMLVYNKIYKYIEPVVKKLEAFYNRYAKPIINFINKYGTKIQKALFKVNQIATFINYIKKGKVFHAFVSGLKLFNKKLYDTLKNTFQKAKDKLSGIFRAIGQVFTNIKNDINSVMKKVNNIGEEIKDTAKKMGWKKIASIGDAIQKIAIKTIQKVRVKVGKITTTLEKAFSVVSSPLNFYLQVARMTEDELEKFKPYYSYALGRVLNGGKEAKISIYQNPKWISEIIERYGK